MTPEFLANLRFWISIAAADELVAIVAQIRDELLHRRRPLAFVKESTRLRPKRRPGPQPQERAS